MSLDYSLALRQLGGNISFNRFQATYRRYYKLKSLRGTVLAGNASLGLANDVDGLNLNLTLPNTKGQPVHPFHYQTVCTENLSPSWNESGGAPADQRRSPSYHQREGNTSMDVRSLIVLVAALLLFLAIGV